MFWIIEKHKVSSISMELKVSQLVHRLSEYNIVDAEQFEDHFKKEASKIKSGNCYKAQWNYSIKIINEKHFEIWKMKGDEYNYLMFTLKYNYNYKPITNPILNK